MCRLGRQAVDLVDPEEPGFQEVLSSVRADREPWALREAEQELDDHGLHRLDVSQHARVVHRDLRALLSWNRGAIRKGAAQDYPGFGEELVSGCRYPSGVRQ